MVVKAQCWPSSFLPHVSKLATPMACNNLDPERGLTFGQPQQEQKKQYTVNITYYKYVHMRTFRACCAFYVNFGCCGLLFDTGLLMIGCVFSHLIGLVVVRPSGSTAW